jgi:hypothetical protein
VLPAIYYTERLIVQLEGDIAVKVPRKQANL